MPFYHQVIVESEHASDLPIPQTGEERAIASTQAIIVATRPEDDGDVMIEVHHGAVEECPGRQVYDGELSFSTPRLVVGSYLANQLLTVDVGRIGWIPVKIYVDPPDEPSRVLVVLP
jgi:hypothetical protein